MRLEKNRAGRNRTIGLTKREADALRPRLLTLDKKAAPEDIAGRIINQDLAAALPFLPDAFVDLLFIDPPYNLDKKYNSLKFKKSALDDYAAWMESWMSGLSRLLKPTASIYICSEWQTSTAVHLVARKFFKVRNRITWEREKGRGAAANWKNCAEDIWFCTVSDRYTFDLDAVKLKRRVIAPYTGGDGEPKDWERTGGGGFRLTHPSNIWNDITVPFWSMPENTDHPTQKPEKLLAKLILASSKPGDVVFDPFAGAGTSCVTAKKLGRRFAGVEIDETFCLLAEKRLALADKDSSIQGYSDGVFWERNTLQQQKRPPRGKG